jgi:hypothetical protein
MPARPIDGLTIDDIDVGDFAVSDIAGVLDYWYRSPPDNFLALGLCREALPSESCMREMLEMAAEGGVSPAVPGSAILTIRLRGEAIGVHELTHVAARSSGMMHAHIWNRSHRGLGIGLVSYVKAMQKFFERFDLKQIVFETPEANIGARQIKARLGIAPQGRGSIKLPILSRPLPTISYRVLCSEIPIIERNMRAAWQQRQAKLPAAAPPEAWAPGE